MTNETETIPDGLEERWELRDARYLRRRKLWTPAEIASVRAWRLGEAEESGEPSLIVAARQWEIPA